MWLGLTFYNCIAPVIPEVVELAHKRTHLRQQAKVFAAVMLVQVSLYYAVSILATVDPSWSQEIEAKCEGRAESWAFAKSTFR